MNRLALPPADTLFPLSWPFLGCPSGPVAAADLIWSLAGQEESTSAEDDRNPRNDGGLSSTPGGTRTPNLLIRSQTLYPIELRAQGRWIIAGLRPDDQPKMSVARGLLRHVRTLPVINRRKNG